MDIWSNENKDYRERDRQFIWHPYTQMKTSSAPVPIVRGEGVYLIDDQGKKYIDAISSWWVNIHGHAHPYIAEKVAEQLKILEHVIFAGFTHPGAIELAERLLSHLPDNQSKVFYSDNGSTAVEVGMKMAFQYWYNRGIEKTKIVAFKNAYHGDTFGTMSVSGRSIFTNPFAHFLFDVEFIDVPVAGKESDAISQLKDILESNEVASFIFEPLIQGAGGMIMYDSEPLGEMITICCENDVLTIADEVMTGFGRTGKLFATDYLKNNPDIICFSKALTGGTMAMGLTTCTEKIYEAFLSDDKLKTFFHGHSFTANPVACAAAIASLDLVERQEFKEDIERINKQHKHFLANIIDHPKVENARLMGTILAFELKTDSETSYLNKERDNIYEFFLKRNILLRPLGNTIYLMPPYCIGINDLSYIYEVIYQFLNG